MIIAVPKCRPRIPVKFYKVTRRELTAVDCHFCEILKHCQFIPPSWDLSLFSGPPSQSLSFSIIIIITVHCLFTIYRALPFQHNFCFVFSPFFFIQKTAEQSGKCCAILQDRQRCTKLRLLHLNPACLYLRAGPFSELTQAPRTKKMNVSSLLSL